MFLKKIISSNNYILVISYILYKKLIQLSNHLQISCLDLRTSDLYYKYVILIFDTFIILYMHDVLITIFNINKIFYAQFLKKSQY